MEIITTINALRNMISTVKSAGKTIGFVPTMGALHNGHKSMIDRAVRENDMCVASIFINPTQFNNTQDLAKYPRTLERDCALLEKAGCTVVFAPKAEEIYTKEETEKPFEFDFGGLDSIMEGKFRPAHFNGVVQIVSKLFAFVQPDRAYFGEKDFQQLAIIHRLNEKMNFGIEIIDCQIIREENGLALSSRNERLTAEERKTAAKISQILFKNTTFAPAILPQTLEKKIFDEINATEGLTAEYVEIVDSKTLQKIVLWQQPAVCCVAVFCGEIRLIDNMRIKLGIRNE